MSATTMFRDDVWMLYVEESEHEGEAPTREDFEVYLALAFDEVPNPDNDEEPFYIAKADRL